MCYDSWEHIESKKDHLMAQVWLHISEINIACRKIEIEILNSSMIYLSLLILFFLENQKLRANKDPKMIQK